MKLNELLPKKVQAIIKELLNLDDYEDVATNTGFSFALVNNVANRRSKISETNQAIYFELLEKCLIRVSEHNELKKEIIKLIKAK